MEIIRFTFRIPKYLIAKVRVLAKQNNISVNKQLIELVEFGIKYFLEKTSKFETVKFEKE